MCRKVVILKGAYSYIEQNMIFEEYECKIKDFGNGDIYVSIPLINILTKAIELHFTYDSLEYMVAMMKEYALKSILFNGIENCIVTQEKEGRKYE